MSYRVACYVGTSKASAHNALVFSTAEDALAYGNDLKSRWTMLTSFDVEATTDPVTVQPQDLHKHLRGADHRVQL